MEKVILSPFFVVVDIILRHFPHAVTPPDEDPAHHRLHADGHLRPVRHRIPGRGHHTVHHEPQKHRPVPRQQKHSKRETLPLLRGECGHDTVWNHLPGDVCDGVKWQADLIG